MSRIRLNTRFLATEGIPEIMTIGMIPFMMLAYFCGWVHGGIDTTFCVVVCFLCVWSAGYKEWQSVKEKISRLHFGIFGLSYLTVMACGTKLYAMTDMSEMHKLFVLAIVMVPCVMIAVNYLNTIRMAEKIEEKDRKHRIAVAGYKALWAVAGLLLAYSACFWLVYYCGEALTSYFGISRFESWQVALHNMLDF